jgi:adenylate cyclase
VLPLLPLLPQMLAPAVVLLVLVVALLANVEVQVGMDPSTAALAERLASPSLWALLLCGLTVVVALPLLPVLAGAVLTGICSGIIFAVSFFSVPAPSVSMEFSLIVLTLLYVLHLSQRAVSEASQKQRVIEAIGRYIPGPLARRLSLDPSEFGLRAESRELTVLFCDVRGFTGIAERLEPEDLSEMLNALLTPITRIVHQHGGTVDKYIGDAVMAFWGAPEDDPHHAANAVMAALDIQRAASSLRGRFRERDWPPLYLGVGVNTGVVRVGNMGSEYRMSYTAIGDAVNLASRLEELTAVYHTHIIVGASTRRAFPSMNYRELGLLEIKGKQELARVYEPIDPRLSPEDTVLVSMRQHNKALACYYHRDWDGARARFTELQRKHPADPLYRHYLERIEVYQRHPPPEGWQGEIRYTVE